MSPGRWLYQFPFAAITSCYKTGDVKQHRFIILGFWMSDVRDGTHGAKVKILPRLFSLWQF